MEPATFSGPFNHHGAGERGPATGVSHSTGFKDSGIFYITGSTSSTISAINTVAPTVVVPAHVWTPKHLGAVLRAFQPKRAR